MTTSSGVEEWLARLYTRARAQTHTHTRTHAYFVAWPSFYLHARTHGFYLYVTFKLVKGFRDKE